MVLTLREILTFDVLAAAGAELLAGQDALDRPVRWVHSSEIYEIGPLLSGGELLLTTGLGLAGADAGACRHYVRELAERGVAGVAVELGRSLPDMPYAILDESRRRHLPLLALRQVVPFIRITEAVNTAIVTATLTERPHRPGAAAVLADLEAGTALSQQEVTARLRALRFRPDRAHRVIAAAAHPAAGTSAHTPGHPGAPAAGALLDRAADLLGAPLLRDALGTAALLTVPRSVPGDPVCAALSALEAAGTEAGAGGAGGARVPGTSSAADPGAAGLTLALGPAVRADAGWRRWGESLREARIALRLALTVPIPQARRTAGGSVLTTSRALALERELLGDGLTAATRDRLGRLVDRALGPLLGWEAAHPSDLVHTLEVHLRNGCSPTRTAALLHVGRQSLYQRLDRIESLLGLRVSDPDSHGELLLAACAHRLLQAAD
ncbi:PucR family transcriptional regulator [Streptomyces sp. KK5PA1]|uniref:PucR family transcriptional regulator n=2 Tax=Actinacidiphila acididurans TaxID=2784346 RepID=A0ABS2U452_9ACTN|nr:PucR family transcriptional regulator [Actinacidiphila acididurans]